MFGDYVLPRAANPSTPLRLGVLISGSGSGLEALLRHQKNLGKTGKCSHLTVVVISDKAGVKGLERAAEHGVEAICLPLPPPSEFDSAAERRRAHENELSIILDEHGVELVVCSGYMRILTEEFLTSRLGRVVNIHPSPWGESGALFPGAHGIRDTLSSGSEVAGASVHFVSAGVDDGPLIASVTTPIDAGESEEALGERVRHEIEHILYPVVIDALAEGRVVEEEGRFTIKD